jgi:DNA gyrase subunit B
MYIGDTGSSGLHKVVFLALGPAVEEARAGFATKVDVTLHAGGAMTVENNGRPAPMAADPYNGVRAIETEMTVLHAGGCARGRGFDPSWYQPAGALQLPGGWGGLVIVNGLSSRIDITVWDNGTEYAMAFENGERVAALRSVGNAAGRGGTRITFTPSPEIFSTCEIGYETVHEELRKLAPQCPNTSFVLEDLRQDPPERVELSPNA